MKPTKKPAPADRPKQQTPEELITDLMQFVRSSFYQDSPAWFTDQHFIRRKVVTWPAGWLNSRGVTLPPGRYKEVLTGVFVTIKRNGNTGMVKYWPGYLLHCLQEHFKHHGEEYYEEGKSLRAATDLALTACQRATRANREPDVVAGIAQVHKAMMSFHRKRTPVKPRDQLSLF